MSPGTAASTSTALPAWLQSRGLLAAGLAAALMVLVAALGFMAYERRELREATVEQGALYARVLEDHANRTFNAVDLAMGAALEAARLQRQQGSNLQLSPLLQQSIQALPFLRSISLVDARGRVVASSAPANVGVQVQRKRLLPAANASGLGPLLPGRDLAELAQLPASADAASHAGARLLPLLLPLQPGADSDWLVATINPDFFANQYDLLLQGTPLRASLLSFGGQLLVPAAAGGQAAGTWLKTQPLFTQAVQVGRENGQWLGTGLDGVPMFMAWRTARRQPLVVLVETPQAMLQAQLRAIGLNVAAGCLLLLAGLGAVTFLAWRSLRSHEAVRIDLQAARGSLAAQDAFTDRLFQVSPIPMVVKDADGRFLRVNQAWEGLTGIAAARAIGQNLGRLYPPQLAAPHEAQEQMAIASMQAVAYEEQILDSDGLPRDVMVRLTPFADAGGQVAGLISCLMDVTEYREAAQRTTEAKDAAERSNAAKGEFLANISHELRTPLQSILGFSELGDMRTASQPRLQGMFASIHDAGQRMLALVNNLLDLSRLESPVGEIQRVPQDIAPALRAVRDELQGLAQARQLSLQLPGAAAPALWAQADAVRLQQVLRNVLANAIRFAPEGSTITVDWQARPGGEHHITVRDHGPGIPVAELESIFEAFVQSSRTKDGSGGTGLGLAICRKIMDGHDGRIIARNHPAGGAVFQMVLPALTETEVAVEQAMRKAGP
ncbi:MAG: ATP-binding protein [Aquabacterium sp.]|nr:ATP-binding protein [Aquabacterium sp.]